MNRNALGMGVVLVFTCIVGGVTSHKTPQYSVKIGPRKSGRTLLHTLPVQTELQNLASTLGALANADGRRADLLLHKAAKEAWNAAQIVANPLMESTSPAFSARRKLQQLAQVAPLGSPELNDWLLKGPLGVSTTTAASSSSPPLPTFPNFPGGFDLGNFQLPQLSPDALKSVTQFLNSTAQSLLLTRAIGGMMDQTISDVSKSFTKYRIKAPTGPSTVNTRRLHQAVNDKEMLSESSSVEVTAADVVKALQQLQQAAEAVNVVGGPVESVDLQLSDDNKQYATSMKRRLLSSANGDINAFATQLQQQVQEAVAIWQRLDNGAEISSDEVKTYLAARAAGLRQRFENLKSRFEAAANAAKTSTQRRVLQSHNKTPEAATTTMATPVAPAPEVEEEIFDLSPVSYSTSTVLILMTPADAEDSTAFIDDVLNFLMDTLTASSIAPTDYSSAFSLPQAFGLGVPMYRPDESDDRYFREMYGGSPLAEDYEGEESDELLKLLMGSVTGAAARGPEQHSTAMEIEFSNDSQPKTTTQTLPVDAAVAKGVLLDRRRQLLSYASSAYDQEFNDDFLDKEYEQEEAWLWVAGDDDWMSSEASIEEAILQYADEANESELLDLVVKLVAPVDKNGEGISPALLEILLDPANASVAQLLKELAAGPAGGEISVAKQSEPGKAIIPPRFAVFGPSVASGFGQAAAVGAHLPRPPQTQQRDSNNGNGKMVDMVVAPLRGPKPHTERDVPSGMDARWWGVVLGLGGLGLLVLGAAAVAVMKSPSEFSQLRNGDDSVHGGGGNGRADAAVKGGYEPIVSPQRSTSPWENKGQQVAKVKASSGTSRKTSNLPA